MINPTTKHHEQAIGLLPFVASAVTVFTIWLTDKLNGKDTDKDNTNNTDTKKD